MTDTRARAYARLRHLVADRSDLFDAGRAERIMRAAETLVFARTWREAEVVSAIADVRELAADMLTERPLDDVARVFDLLEELAPADLSDRTAVATAA